MTFSKSLPDLPGTKEWIFFGKAPYLMAVGQLLVKVIQTHKTLQIHWKDSNFGDKYDRKWLKYLFLGFDRKNLTGTFSNRLRLISLAWLVSNHDDVIKWSYFPRYWPFVRGIHRSPVNSPHKGQWRGALMFSLICIWINGWVNNRQAGDLRRYSTHYDVIVMTYPVLIMYITHRVQPRA